MRYRADLNFDFILPYNKFFQMGESGYNTIILYYKMACYASYYEQQQAPLFTLMPNIEQEQFIIF